MSRCEHYYNLVIIIQYLELFVVISSRRGLGCLGRAKEFYSLQEDMRYQGVHKFYDA